MKHILAPEQHAVLHRFAQRDTLLALDYDGTLAPIVADRGQAHMRASTRELLIQAARRYQTVVITGRSRLDVMRFLTGIASLEIIGNHGLESEGIAMSRFLRRVAAWRLALGERLRPLAGIMIEDKRYSLSVHYRQCEDKAAAGAVIQQAAMRMPGVRIVGGKDVLNLVPEEAPNKGSALLAACARMGCLRAIYVGDDDTDEDVFALARPEHLLGIRVGSDPDTAAKFCLRDQAEIDDLLRLLLSQARPPARLRAHPTA